MTPIYKINRIYYTDKKDKSIYNQNERHSKVVSMVEVAFELSLYFWVESAWQRWDKKEEMVHVRDGGDWRAKVGKCHLKGCMDTNNSVVIAEGRGVYRG